MPFSMNHASALAWPVVQAGAGPVYLLKVHLGVVVFHEKASDLSSYLPVTPLPIVLNTNCNLFLAARMPNCLEPLVCVFFYDPCFREGVTGGPGRGRNLTKSTDQTLEPNTHRRRIPKGGQNFNTSSPSVNHTCWLADTTRISLHAHVCHDNTMKRPWADLCAFNERSWSFAPQTG